MLLLPNDRSDLPHDRFEDVVRLRDRRQRFQTGGSSDDEVLIKLRVTDPPPGIVPVSCGSSLERRLEHQPT